MKRVSVECDLCGGVIKKDSDTMDTFYIKIGNNLDSCDEQDILEIKERISQYRLHIPEVCEGCIVQIYEGIMEKYVENNLKRTTIHKIPRVRGGVVSNHSEPKGKEPGTFTTGSGVVSRKL